MIERSLYEHLISQDSISPFLAVYGGNPAVFNQEAPDDQDIGWESESQYGRIVFSVENQGDPEREISTTLMVDFSVEESQEPPENVEPLIRSLIDGYFFNTVESGPMYAKFVSSNYFTEPAKRVCGVTIVFSLLAFPIQTTGIEPDPIQLMNEWTKSMFPDSVVIGYDTNSMNSWKPTNESPAIYWRTIQTVPANWIPDTYSCSWFTASLRAHIMAPDTDTVNTICRNIEITLTYSKRLIFSDDSPLMVDRNIQAQYGADALRQGQITVTGTYGVLTPKRNSPKLNHYYAQEAKNGN